MESSVVRVTEKGQATIPSAMRKRHGIAAPGLVRFVERGGKLVVEPVASPGAMFGALKDAFRGESAQDVVRRERQADKAREARKFRDRRP